MNAAQVAARIKLLESMLDSYANAPLRVTVKIKAELRSLGWGRC